MPPFQLSHLTTDLPMLLDLKKKLLPDFDIFTKKVFQSFE